MHRFFLGISNCTSQGSSKKQNQWDIHRRDLRGDLLGKLTHIIMEAKEDPWQDVYNLEMQG